VEESFHDAIFQRMKGDDADASSWAQGLKGLRQAHFQLLQLSVDGDA
jgi:hypothetical protein